MLNKKFVACFLFIGGLASAFAAQVDIFTAKDLQATAQSLIPKGPVNADKTLSRYSNHYLLLVKRDETGSSEVHEHEADLFVVESGEGAILTGGKMRGGHAIKPGEIRGSGIDGAERHALTAGDVIHIPAGVPHQLVLPKGKPFVYFVVKVTGQ
jgi:mannose-6-phosphate isomerase-like protein (cupin superfamily)